MRILITGGAGFQGTHLTKRLLDEGHNITLFNSSSLQSVKNVRSLFTEDFSEHFDRFKLVWGSITDPVAVEKVVREQDLVFHLAALIHVDESIGEPRKFYETNVLGTFNIVNNCAKYNVPIIHVSTCEVYGGCNQCEKFEKCDRMIRETCPLKPQSPYAGSKAGADRLVSSHGITYDLSYLILRPFNIYGPGQRSGKRGAVIPRFVKNALTDKPIEIYGSGKQKRDFVFIEDLIDAYHFLMNNFLHHINEYHNYKTDTERIINIGTGMSYSILEIARMIKEIVEKKTGKEVKIERKSCRSGEVQDFRGHPGRLYDLGFKFNYELEEGLEKYIEWYMKNEMKKG